MKDLPWHKAARKLAAAGATQEAIAEAVERSLGSVRKLLIPSERESVRARMLRRYHRKMLDPAWRIENESATDRRG